jgi:hypothetical protein
VLRHLILARLKEHIEMLFQILRLIRLATQDKLLNRVMGHNVAEAGSQQNRSLGPPGAHCAREFNAVRAARHNNIEKQYVYSAFFLEHFQGRYGIRGGVNAKSELHQRFACCAHDIGIVFDQQNRGALASVPGRIRRPGRCRLTSDGGRKKKRNRGALTLSAFYAYTAS